MADYPRALRARAFAAQAKRPPAGRPGYPLEAIRACLPGAAKRVLDLGAGTGKLTVGLLTLGLDVVAVEPLKQMRRLIPPAAEAVDGTAEAVPLPDQSVDAVTVGQAFHWFDQARALAEIRPALRPGDPRPAVEHARRPGAVGRRPHGCFHAEDRATQPLNADLLVENIASRRRSSSPRSASGPRYCAVCARPPQRVSSCLV